MIRHHAIGMYFELMLVDGVRQGIEPDHMIASVMIDWGTPVTPRCHVVNRARKLSSGRSAHPAKLPVLYLGVPDVDQPVELVSRGA